MPESRVIRFSEVAWWPSPAHAGAMLIIARSTYHDPDPTATGDCAGWIRVRASQLEIAETLNVTAKTIRRVFTDMHEMGVIQPANGSRVWYLNPKADDPAGFTRRMLSEWPKLQAKRRSGAAEEQPQPGEQPDDAEDMAWYNEPQPVEAAALTPPAPTGLPPEVLPSGLSKQIDGILNPTSPPNTKLRLTTAMSYACTEHAIHISQAWEWAITRYGGEEGVIAYLRTAPFVTIADWIEAYAKDIIAFSPEPID